MVLLIINNIKHLAENATHKINQCLLKEVQSLSNFK